MPLTADDYLEIQGLYSRVSRLSDEDKAEEYARLFTPDGVFTVRRPGVSPETIRGTAELVAHIHGHGDRFRERGIRHTISNVVIEPSETGARGAAYLAVLRVGDQQPPIVWITGKFADELVKTADGWRFRSRILAED